MAHYPKRGRDVVQHLRHVLAQAPQGAAAGWARTGGGVLDHVAWQVIGQRAPGRFGGAGCVGRLRGDGGGSSVLRALLLLHILQRQF